MLFKTTQVLFLASMTKNAARFLSFRCFFVRVFVVERMEGGGGGRCVLGTPSLLACRVSRSSPLAWSLPGSGVQACFVPVKVLFAVVQ